MKERSTPILASIATSVRGTSLRQIRLICGFILFGYLISHFLNHALGNISLDALAWGVHYHLLFWQFLPVAIIFYTAVLVHSSLGIWALYQRRQFSWRAIEPLQLLLGLSIPALIAAHMISVRLGYTLFGHQRLYRQVLYGYFVAYPSFRIWLTLSALVVAWIHGSIGLYFWLRMKPFFKTAAPLLLAAAVLVPTLAMLGVYQGGRTVAKDSASAEWRAANLSPDKIGTPAESDTLETIAEYFLIGYLGLLAIALVGRRIRALHERRGGMITLSYGNGRVIRVPKGLSVLEASLRHRVPHASVCGGRARCSTCRIRVIGDCSALPQPSNREAFVLNRVGTGSDPAVRLACQLRPETDLSFFQIFTPQDTAGRVGRTHAGEERYLVSLFVDMRGSTRLAEKRLPFDTVFVVNRFLAAVSQAVVECGGEPNQFLGDGQLALFGLSTNRQNACRQALQAAAKIAANVEQLNQFLTHDLREPIRFGIGLHGGEVIVGDIGYRDHMVFTALGDAVNVAARLQDMTKALACEAVVSSEVFTSAGLPAEALPRQDVEIRGRKEPMGVYVVAKAAALAVMVGDKKPAAA